MGGYDEVGPNTPTRHVKKLLTRARAQGNIYAIVRIVGVLRYRGCSVNLYLSERKALYKALKTVRKGQKILAHWLPIGYQTARFIWLAKEFSGRRIIVTKRDKRRIKNAAHYYREKNDKWSRRQLRSLVLTGKEIGLTIQGPLR